MWQNSPTDSVGPWRGASAPSTLGEVDMKKTLWMTGGLVAAITMGALTSGAFALGRFRVAAQPADQTQALKAEVNGFMDLYWQLFSSGNIDQLVERIYHPSGQLSNQG